jgi:integrase
MLPPAPDRWTIDQANTERTEAVAAFGFTERQARFLVSVLLHSGVFVERQYCSFAGIVHGQTRQMVQYRVLRASRRAKLSQDGVHILRHTFCSHLAMRGAPPRAIQSSPVIVSSA